MEGPGPDLSANCGLSIPAVITGSNYNIHVQAPEFRLHHIYRFDDTAFASPSSATDCNSWRFGADELTSVSRLPRKLLKRSLTDSELTLRLFFLHPDPIFRPLNSLSCP
jgi:hypothetical protein